MPSHPKPDDSEANDSLSHLAKSLLKYLPPRYRKLLKPILGVLLPLGSLATVRTWLSERVTALPLDRTTVIIVSVLLGITVFLLLWQAFQRDSSFRHPNVLRAPGNCHLIRAKDIAEVLDRLRDSTLVFLVGRPGVGKTTFLKADLLVALNANEAYYPIYVDHWGIDWADGPRRIITRALSADKSLREQLALKASIMPDQALTIVSDINDKLNRVPIFLFDQFDDYYAEHRSKFSRGQGHHEQQVLKPEQLIENNSFWRDVSELMNAEKIRCLFAACDEALLDPVRFPGQQATTYPLELLAAESAAALLDELADKAGLRYPEASFDALRKRLIADLGGDYHLVVPAQMNLAFRGLTWFDPLSLAHYEHAGGLDGIIANAVEHAIAQAAGMVPCEPEELRQLLLALTDSSTRTTTPRTERELLDRLPPPRPEPRRLANALSNLRDADILARNVAPDSDEWVWQLDHKYLWPIVAESHRPERERSWQQVLDDAAGAFSSATDLKGRRRTWLRPRYQIRIAYERLRGRLSYGSARGFARQSMFRLILNPVFLALILLILAWRQVVAGRIDSGKTLGFAVDNSGFIQSGLVTCWGNNDSSQVAPSPLQKFFQVTAGGSGSCALKADDLSVICWGDPAIKNTPRGSFYQVNAGGSHACGLRTDHRIACWGNNDNGQLGPAPDAEYSQVSAGQVHSCGRKLDGSIVCWGANTKPWKAPDGYYTQVAAAISPDAYSCGRMNDGSVTCWTPSGRPLPRITEPYLGISAAGSFTCGLKEKDRRVACWENYSGQPWGHPGDDTYIHVSTGRDHACGLKDNGSLFCWGDDNRYHTILPLPTDSYFHVAAGSLHNCALRKD